MTQLVHTFNPDLPSPEWERAFFEEPVEIDPHGLGAIALLEDPKDSARDSFAKRQRDRQDHGTAATEHGLKDTRELRAYDRFRLHAVELADDDYVAESLEGNVSPSELDAITSDLYNRDDHAPVSFSVDYDGPGLTRRDQKKATTRVDSHDKLADSLATLVASGRISPMSAYRRYVSTLDHEDKSLFEAKAAQFMFADSPRKK